MTPADTSFSTLSSKVLIRTINRYMPTSFSLSIATVSSSLWDVRILLFLRTGLDNGMKGRGFTYGRGRSRGIPARAEAPDATRLPLLAAPFVWLASSLLEYDA